MLRAAIWFVGLFILAAAVALFAGNNHGMISLFWHPYRVDLSLNMVLVILIVAFTLGYFALRTLSALIQLPRQAKRWRQQQKERKMYQALVTSLAHLQGGRYLRARKSAAELLKLSDKLQDAQASVPQDASLRAIAHMLAADSAHALRDIPARDQYYEQALQAVPATGNTQQLEIRESAQMRAARWALDDHEPDEALQRLQQLPAGASRRTMALRIQLKANRLAQQTHAALDTARLLAKHGGLSVETATSITRGLILELLRSACDQEQLIRTWESLTDTERKNPDITLAAVQQLIALEGPAQLARKWIMPVWEKFVETPNALNPSQATQLFITLPLAFDGLDSIWLSRIEALYRAHPRDARLQYLAAMACMQHQLWGKAERLLQNAVERLSDAALRASAWKALALLAQQREDDKAALHAWRQAALEAPY